MTDIDKYLKAGTKENTRRSYKFAVKHFEETCGRVLPATGESVAHYLADNAKILSSNTLKQRLAALSRWHKDFGFPDPTKHPKVKQVLSGIKAIHSYQQKQAKPIQLSELEQIIQYLDAEIKQLSQRKDLLPLVRNKSMVLMGFWRAFRSDELTKLTVEAITVIPDKGLQLFIPRSKTDKTNDGKTYQVPYLSRLCPVNAYLDWIHLAMITEGPVYCAIDRWGNVNDNHLHSNSVIPILRDLMKKAGIAGADDYSSHSLRRGFSSWANSNHWDLNALMKYVGWTDPRSALRYLDDSELFQQRIEQGLAIESANTNESLILTSSPT